MCYAINEYIKTHWACAQWGPMLIAIWLHPLHPLWYSLPFRTIHIIGVMTTWEQDKHGWVTLLFIIFIIFSKNIDISTPQEHIWKQIWVPSIREKLTLKMTINQLTILFGIIFSMVWQVGIHQTLQCFISFYPKVWKGNSTLGMLILQAFPIADLFYIKTNKDMCILIYWFILLII